MNLKNRFFVIFLSVVFFTTSAFAADENCRYSKYRRLHPERCEDSYIQKNTTIALLGGAALVGLGIALANQTSSDSTPSSKITNQSSFPRSSYANYELNATIQNNQIEADYINSQNLADDIDFQTIDLIKHSEKFTRNYAQFDAINYAWAVARGFSGKNAKIAVVDDFNSYHGNAVYNILSNIANDANINKYSVTSGSNQFVSYNEIANVYSKINSVDIYNNSWQIIATEQNNAATSIYNSDQTLKTYAQAQQYIYNETSANFINQIIEHAIHDDSIFVWAAGNESLSESGVLSAIPIAFPEIQGHFINVVSFDTNTNEIAWYSNQCGITQNYCISAPGSAIQPDNSEIRVSGTSFAVPIVSGAIATIKEAFPYMNATEITELLFVTAKDLGDPGIDSVYGWGLLDMEKATKPVGNAKIILSNNTIKPLHKINVSGNIASAIKNSGLKLAFFDDFGRAFNTKLSDNIHIVNRSRIFDKLHETENNSFTIFDNFEFGVQKNNLFEGEDFISNQSNSLMNFIGYKNNINFNDVQFYQNIRFESSSLTPDKNSIISDISNIYSTTLKFGLKWNDFALEMMIPNQIIHGNMSVNVPTGRDIDGNIIYIKQNIDLVNKPIQEFTLKYKNLYMGFVNNHDTKDEFYIMTKTKFAF